jgi:hypothetical protein
MNSTPTKHAPDLIGATVETQLQSVADRLALGDLELSACTPGIQALWVTAFEDGRKCHDAKCAEQCDRLTWERDYFYFRFANPRLNYCATITGALWDRAATA